MKNGKKSSLYGETSLYSEEIPYSELFSKIHYIEYPLYFSNMFLKELKKLVQNKTMVSLHCI